MATEAVGVVNESGNVPPFRTVKPVAAGSTSRVAGLTLGQIASRAATEESIDWKNRLRHPVEITPLPESLYLGEPADAVQASAQELATIDLFLNDPLNSRLIELFSPGPVAANSEYSQQLVARYGEQRFARMKRYQEAHERARDHFRDSINAARRQPPPEYVREYRFEDGLQPPALPPNTPPGWKLVLVPIYENGNEAGALFRGYTVQWDFDSAAYARWYGQQGGASNQVFAAMYGQGAVQIDPPTDNDPAYEFNGRPPKVLILGNGAWIFNLESGAMISTDRIRSVHSEQVNLRDGSAIQFDPLLGLASDSSNFIEEQGWDDHLIQVVSVVAIACIAAQTGAWVGQGFAAGSTAGAVAGGAMAGATGAALSSAVNGTFDFASVLRGALSGALTAGIAQLPFGEGGTTLGNLGYSELPIGGVSVDVGLRTVSIAGQSTLRGLLTEAMGGKFQDGLKQGVLQLIATEFTRGVGQYIKDNQVTAADATVLRYLSQMAGSAIRTIGSPGSAGQSTAQSLLETLLGDVPRADGALPPNPQEGYSSVTAPSTPTVVVEPIVVAAPEAATTPLPPVATVSPALVGPVYDVRPIDTPAEPAADHTQPISFGTPVAPSFAGEHDAPDPNALDAVPEASGEEPDLLARNTASGTRTDARSAVPRNMVPTTSINGVATPPLDPVTGQPVEIRSPGGLNERPMWMPIPTQTEQDIAALLQRQALSQTDSSVKLTEWEQQRIDAVNYIKRERALAAGATEGNGFVTDARGNVRTFDLDNKGEISIKPGERIVQTSYYRAASGEIVYVDNMRSIPVGVDPNQIRLAQSHYFGDQLIARDFSVPDDFAGSVRGQNVTAGDSIGAIRRQVSVPPTGPFAELAQYIDKGSGQVNPLQWEEFKARAAEIAIAQGTPARMVVTSNGMVNSYQQAQANAVQLASGIPNAIVVNVLNPSTGSYFFDTVEALQPRLGVQQTVSTSIATQMREAQAFQDNILKDLREINVPLQPINLLVVAHSQGTVNMNQALSLLGDRSMLERIDTLYLGTAVNSLPIGLANAMNVTDVNDKVSTSYTRGFDAINNTFASMSGTFNESAPGIQTESTSVPPNYRQVTTNFNSERVAGNPSNTPLPTGNYHSMHLYLMRPEVQSELARMIGVDSVRFVPRLIPPFTELPSSGPNG